MLDQLEAASRLLADAKVDVIVFHCTAVSTFAPDQAQGIRDRIERATKIRSFTTADAILKALTRLGAEKVALLTPYIDEVHAREMAFLQTNGFVAKAAPISASTPTRRWPPCRHRTFSNGPRKTAGVPRMSVSSVARPSGRPRSARSSNELSTCP